MTKELRIEYYLMQLDQNLSALPVGQRAEIITEIKSHIHEVIEKDPQRDIEAILGDLGTPRQSAERYLLAKGITATPSRRGGALKWLALGAVAVFAFIFVSALWALWYVSPLIHVDEAKGRVTLFGGLIDVNEKLGHVKVGGLEVNQALNDESVNVSGEEDIETAHVKTMKIPFNTAKLEINSTDGHSIKWACKTVGNEGPKTTLEAGIFNLNLDALNIAKCTISIPRGMTTDFHGINGQMEVRAVEDSMNISLVNGKVNIKLDPDRVYDFDVKVKNGLQDFFPRSGAKEAVRVKVDVVNGLVKKE